MYGKFIENTAGYEINTLNLPVSWEYIYENKDILLKMDQFGPVYAQAHPPGDIMIFRRETHEKFSPWSVSINGKFTNFFRPNRLGTEAEPHDISITFLPESASYRFTYEGLAVSTEFIIPKHGTEIAMRFSVKNLSGEKRSLSIRPSLIPYMNESAMAPWDKMEWYLDSYAEKGEKMVFTTKRLAADPTAKKRHSASFITDAENLRGYELSLEKFIGQGTVSDPSFCYTDDDRIYSYPPVYACDYEWELAAGEEKELMQVLSLESFEDGMKYFEKGVFEAKKAGRKAEFDELFNKNRIRTSDREFDSYVNYWLPIQMNWVASLDRGWPTGMRGSRDSAQDYTALLYLDTESCRKILLTMMECQRSDGWFPRQYSAKGRHGKHDLRTHVDGGAFFAEFVWKYLAHTGDYTLLDEQIPWLDSDALSSGFDHFRQAVEFYIQPENTGVHGLCKIYGGDWLDAVNGAGLEGRGESVTVSEQTVMSLRYLAEVTKKRCPDADVSGLYAKAEELRDNINRSAFNKEGFYSGVYTDNGDWIFSDHDPDGKRRVYGVSNYYAVISGVADRERTESVFRNTEALRCDKGYRLFYPCLGETPIEKVGRVASGDVCPFAGENGNVYNHGSQGFRARALSEAGKKDELLDMLRWIMPYDQEKHPTEKAFTPPYAIVNCWQQLPGFDHRGLMCFLTGSVAMAMRGVYEWMFGVKPDLDGLTVSPCVPDSLGDIEVKFEYMGKSHLLKREKGVFTLDGNPLH